MRHEPPSDATRREIDALRAELGISGDDESPSGSVTDVADVPPDVERATTASVVETSGPSSESTPITIDEP